MAPSMIYTVLSITMVISLVAITQHIVVVLTTMDNQAMMLVSLMVWWCVKFYQKWLSIFSCDNWIKYYDYYLWKTINCGIETTYPLEANKHYGPSNNYTRDIIELGLIPSLPPGMSSVKLLPRWWSLQSLAMTVQYYTWTKFIAIRCSLQKWFVFLNMANKSGIQKLCLMNCELHIFN